MNVSLKLKGLLIKVSGANVSIRLNKHRYTMHHTIVRYDWDMSDMLLIIHLNQEKTNQCLITLSSQVIISTFWLNLEPMRQTAL